MPWIFLSLLLLTSVHSTSAQENYICFECHAIEDFTTFNDAEEEISLYVNESVFAESVHGILSCIDCHIDLDGTDDSGHDIPLMPVDCALCHDDVTEEYATSIHGKLLETGDSAAPQCYSCHGKHDIYSAADERSTVNKFNLMYTCAQCHDNKELLDRRTFAKPEAVPQFYESVHAKALIRDGLIVAPSCNACHGVHDIKVSADPTSPIYHKNVYKTCGTCHTKVEGVYRHSIHGQLVEQDDERGPVCTDCHQSHNIISPDLLAFKQHSDQICGQCHEDKLDRYHETFHGKAMALGATNVAACYDCHGYHNVAASDDSTSLIHPKNIVSTCQTCHENANEGFASFITHANYFDRQDYPQLYYTFVLMTALLVGVFILFGLHTLLWFIRSVALFLRDSKAFREAKIHVIKDDPVFVRFSPLDRFLHIFMIISFTTLVLTGMPLKFYYTGWADFFIRLFGSVENAGYLHRASAIILIIIFLIHCITLLKSFLKSWPTFQNPETGKLQMSKLADYFFGPNSIIPHSRDFKDFWNHQKWFFGKGPKPKFDRWTYWEKFDYFAVFWGVAIIGFSGLVMWIPHVFTAFLPGWIINVAQIIHSDEALLAAGFIFTFHFFNVHFRIEKFPMDTVIFSGRISDAEMKEERGAWRNRLVQANQLEEIKVRDEWEGWKPIVKTFGFIAFSVGVILALIIFTAMLIRLFHA